MIPGGRVYKRVPPLALRQGAVTAGVVLTGRGHLRGVWGGPSSQGAALRELATEDLVERAAVLPCHRGHDGEVLLSRCPSTREGVHRLEGPREG